MPPEIYKIRYFLICGGIYHFTGIYNFKSAYYTDSLDICIQMLFSEVLNESTSFCLNSEMRMFLLLLISQFNLEPISDLNAIGIKAYIACGGHNNSRLNWYNNKKEIVSQKGKM